VFHDDGELEDAVAVAAEVWSDLQHHFEDDGDLLRIFWRDVGVEAARDLLEESLHVVGPEGRFEGNGLVDDAAQGPDIRFFVVGLVLPDLGTGVVGRARLGLAHVPAHL
jgi:hypothetical protein